MEGAETIRRVTLDDPLSGVRAAVLARDVALAELRKYAEEARGAGHSWGDVAEALGIETSDGGDPRDEQAYRLVVEGSAHIRGEKTRGRRATARWICVTCGQRVTDHGPFGSHPDDVEIGHLGSCGRRVAACISFADRLQ
jgi:hypothetical protein